MSLGLGSSLSSSAYSKSSYTVARSVSLEGSDDHIVITNSVADDIKNIGSISIWLKLETASGNDTIMNLHTGTNNDNKIAILFINQGGSELIRINSRGASTNTILDHEYSATDSVNNGWTHFVATWDRTGNKMAMYLNGSSVATSSASIANFATTADTIYNSGRPNIDLTTLSPSPVVFLPLDEASGNFIDRTATGADGVPTNSPTQGVADIP